MHTPAPWRYEASTKTIRSEPANYWLASMDSWDGAVDHEANAQLIAASPALLRAAEELMRALEAHGLNQYFDEQRGEGIVGYVVNVRHAIQQAKGA